MGTEFFNRSKGAIRKSREKQKAKLAGELVPIISESSVINFDTLTAQEFDANQKFEICIENDRLTAFYERSPVAFIKDGQSKIFLEIKAAGGRAVGTYDRLLRRSSKLCLKVTLPPTGIKNEQIRQRGASI